MNKITELKCKKQINKFCKDSSDDKYLYYIKEFKSGTVLIVRKNRTTLSERHMFISKEGYEDIMLQIEFITGIEVF
jgi:hypothetical protein